MLYQEFHLCLFPSIIYLYFCLFVRYRCAVHNTSRYGIVKGLGGKGYILVFLVVVTPMDTPSPPTPSSPMMTTNRLLTTTLTSSVVVTLRTPTSQSLGTSRSICKYHTYFNPFFLRAEAGALYTNTNITFEVCSHSSGSIQMLEVNFLCQNQEFL